MELAIPYSRFSHPSQGKGRSEGRQDDGAESYCARMGYTIIDSYIDRGLSAFHGENTDRGVLKSIIDLAKAGKIRPGTHIVVESLDRLSRQDITVALALFLTMIADCGLVIDSTFDDQVYTKKRCDDDPFAAMGAIMVFMRGNNESKTRSKRLKDARANDRKNAREHGIPVNSHCPAWLVVEGKRGEHRVIVKRDDRVEIVVRIFHAYDDGLGCISIAKMLNRNGIKTFTGKTWSAGTVQRLLRNEAVIGLYEPQIYIGKKKREPDGLGKIEGYYPEIISPALFDRVQRKLDANKNYGKDRKVYGGGQKLSAANLVTGLGWCSEGDDHKLAYRDSGVSLRKDGTPRRHTVYLRCRASLNGACTNTVGYPYQRFEEQLLGVIGFTMQRLISAVVPETDTNELMTRIDDLEATIARKRQAIELNSAELFDLPAGPLRDAMRNRLGDAAVEIEHHETELAEARRTARLTEHENTHSSAARFEAAKVKLNSPDAEERLSARRKLAHELRLRIDRVELGPDRTMMVRMNDGRGGNTLVDLTFTPDHLVGIRYFRDGRSTPLEGTTELALLEAIRELRETRAA